MTPDALAKTDRSRRRMLFTGLFTALAGWIQGGCVRAQPAAGGAGPYVSVSGGRFSLAGRPFVLRGVNYVGSWRTTAPFSSADGTAQIDFWNWHHEWNVAGINQDMQLLRQALNATTLRIALPAREEFEDEVSEHGFGPWYAQDGSIAPEYARKLTQFAQLAQQNGLRLQLCLLWNVGNEIAKAPDSFRPGSPDDAFYANHVRSVASLLSGQPSVLGYSVGNEVLVRWQVNGQQRSSFEPRAAGFMLRRLRDIRQAAPLQLLTVDENVANASGTWHSPSAPLVAIPDVDQCNGGRSIRLADYVDYIGGHFYPPALTEDSVAGGGYETEVARTVAIERAYISAAVATGKPVVLSEFGVREGPDVLSTEDYRTPRDALFREILNEGQKDGLQGALAWQALPRVVLPSGGYTIQPGDQQGAAGGPVQVEIDIPSGAPFRRLLHYLPNFDLFTWDSSGHLQVSAAGQALAAAWPDTPPPPI